MLTSATFSDSGMDGSSTSHIAETPAQEEPTELIPPSEAKVEGGLLDQPPSVGRTASPPADSSYLSLNGNHPPPNGENKLLSYEDSKPGSPADTTEDIDLDNNEELTPPPDSPIEDTLSHTSSIPPNILQDEIVVGSNAHNKSSPTQAPESEDVAMGEAEDKPLIIQHTKRKRVSGVYAESVGEKDVSPAPTEDMDIRRPIRPTKAQSVGGVKGVLLGYWRDSPAENEADKHGVVGFIDIRDRLRTRIQPTTRDGRPMDQRYPIPPGPGGSWVTFDKVAFNDHLVGHNHHVVKEYVKIRAEDHRKDEVSEGRAKLDLEAVEKAAERVRTNPPPDAATAPLVAYGPQVPANAVIPNRPESKKRRLAGSFGVPSESPKSVQPSLDNIPGTRPTRILLGYWKLSSEEDPINKHAVFGILGANDMFRVKLTRETRDGRTVIGNFPSGAGALWIHWDEVEFDPHLRKLSRNEVKEYCRVRQRQLDFGEGPEERVANETKAVYEAQQRVVQSLAIGIPLRKDDPDLLPIAMKGAVVVDSYGHSSGSPASSFVSPRITEELRQSRRLENGPRAAATAAGRHPLPDVEFGAANRTPSGPSPAALERTNSLARREIARLEAAQARADLRAASRETSLGPVAAAAAAAAAGLTSNHSAANGGDGNGNGHFQDNVSRLNKVWEAQEANRLRAGGEDAKIYMGVKYQRKQNGPFQGKLVSQGMIITIDGEDYVEYRVLTKPTFF
ncbi:hypothetical protein CHGG_10175 [Chaetomium globosum CBS 148.51]|uniref:Uncharacterized protein n=1 Tax=Chaetomium globosum (strain ATCC 6205 / CBS 148.51 / DSM 1962 / NBRC 6347 / NRRL 1970) TaxID=306901 RepID=Q2GPC9_CHAGB|nr:uncharacterized protein CHGG_10175 [Chaetomium globosum CBS 148.51]EAQ83771.1 hypothetical protein CHGG_10175 [Chaetomium globosum CBS 148.51]